MSLIKFKIKAKPHFGFSSSHSEVKTRKISDTNIQKFKFYSEFLNSNISIRCTCRIRKTILKYGGIDRYLICNKNIYPELAKLRKQVLNAYNFSISKRLNAALNSPDSSNQEE